MDRMDNSGPRDPGFDSSYCAMVNRPFLSQVSGIISALLVIVLVVMGIVFVYMYGRRNPGGLSERIAMRLEANYKRFGGPNDDSVELEHTKKEQQINNNNNNNNNQRSGSITVTF